MMISPESYKKQFEDATYEELIEERDGLIRFLQEYEKLEKSGDRTGPEWNIHPQPDVRYQVVYGLSRRIDSVYAGEIQQGRCLGR